MGTGAGITAPFGRLLRALRQSRRLTIGEPAEASGIAGRAIGDMERGRSRRPHRRTITAFAQGLDLDEAAHADFLAAARAARPGARTAGFAQASPPTHCRGAYGTASAGRRNWPCCALSPGRPPRDKYHLHLAHAPARLGERAGAAAEYQVVLAPTVLAPAVLALEGRVPADLRDEAPTGLAALTAGRPAPLIRFVR